LKKDLTWEELKPLLMWLRMPCCGANRGVMKDTKFPRSLDCKKCRSVFFVKKEDDRYIFQRAR
jgi:hypothetical protein